MLQYRMENKVFYLFIIINSETGAATGGADAAPTISTSFWGLV
jgi:hypothetical protein